MSLSARTTLLWPWDGVCSTLMTPSALRHRAPKGGKAKPEWEADLAMHGYVEGQPGPSNCGDFYRRCTAWQADLAECGDIHPLSGSHGAGQGSSDIRHMAFANQTCFSANTGRGKSTWETFRWATSRNYDIIVLQEYGPKLSGQLQPGNIVPMSHLRKNVASVRVEGPSS